MNLNTPFSLKNGIWANYSSMVHFLKESFLVFQVFINMSLIRISISHLCRIILSQALQNWDNHSLWFKDKVVGLGYVENGKQPYPHNEHLWPFCSFSSEDSLPALRISLRPKLDLKLNVVLRLATVDNTGWNRALATPDTALIMSGGSSLPKSNRYGQMARYIYLVRFWEGGRWIGGEDGFWDDFNVRQFLDERTILNLILAKIWALPLITVQLEIKRLATR